MRPVPGISLVETLVALTLAALVCAAVAGVLAGELRLSRATAERVQDHEAVRTAAHVLSGELPWLDPAADIRAIAPDSVSGRWFRGGGVVCGDEAGAALVAFRGMRDPEPAKDSVLAETAAGERILPISSVSIAAAACPGDTGLIQRWSMTAPPPPGTPVLIFETGAYVLSTHALRYRRGAGGRQPLTAERLDTHASAFSAAPAGVRVRLRLAPRGDAVAPGPPPELYLRFLNQLLDDSTAATDAPPDSAGGP